MSLIPVANAGIRLVGSQIVSSFASKLFGGGGSDVNLARGFSSRMGLPCTVRDDQKNLVTEYLNSGFSPSDVCSIVQGGVPSMDVIGVQPPLAMPGGAPTTGGNFAMSLVGSTGMSALPTIGRTVGGALARSAPGVYRTVTGRLSSVVLGSGRRFSRRQIGTFIRTVGDIATAAAILGISLQDAADVVTSKTRRRRGISAAQLANAKRVACTISRMARDLNVKPATRRRTSCR